MKFFKNSYGDNTHPLKVILEVEASRITNENCDDDIVLNLAVTSRVRISSPNHAFRRSNKFGASKRRFTRRQVPLVLGRMSDLRKNKPREFGGTLYDEVLARKDNTERSLGLKPSERVETEARTYRINSYGDNGSLVTGDGARERGGTWVNSSVRYSPSLSVTVGAKAKALSHGVVENNTIVTKPYWHDQDALEQIQREQDKVWKRLVDAAQTVYNDSFLFNTLNVRAAA